MEPPFDHYVFIEMDERRLAELRNLETENKGRRNIAIRAGDCNEYLSTRLLKTFSSDRLWRGVVFLDPFGMHVPWSTIELLAKTEHIEVFLNFPVGMAIQRLLPRNGRFTAKQRAKLDDYFGDPGWYDQVYVVEQGLFEEELRKRDDAAERLVTWFRGRLKTAFGYAQRGSGLWGASACFSCGAGQLRPM